MAPPGRVFLTHTPELRRFPAGRSFADAAESAVIRAGGTPFDMAYFTADPRPPAQLFRDAVRSADVFVGIVGFRYGPPVRDRPELSYPELGFEEADEARLPRLVFLLGEQTYGPAELFRDIEHGARQEELRNSLPDSECTVRTVTSPECLEAALYQALVQSDRGGSGAMRGWRRPVFAVPPVRGDEVARPGLMEDLFEAVTRPGDRVVGITTGLRGAGGFGKTTMARLLAHRAEIRERFPDGVVWVSVGNAAGPELAGKVGTVVGLLGGDRPAVTDPLVAGAELGRVVGARRVLLVLDDVWHAGQVEPFLIGGSAVVRLFTTRVPNVLPGSAELVRVDQMDRDEAAHLLRAGLAGVSGAAVAGSSAVTGRWPVLLALVNGAVRADQHAGRRAQDSMGEILAELRATGPAVLDVGDAGERHAAVARTIEVGLHRLTAEQRDRYLEMAVFRADVAIPGPVLARYWTVTGGWSASRARRLCQRLARLALLSDHRSDPDRVVLHDVNVAYLREQVRTRLGELHRALVDAHRDLVPEENGTSAWWRLPAEQTYLWTWLPAHLRSAGLDHELRACLHHPGWLIGKLEQAGPSGLVADLALSDDPLSRTLRTVVRRNAHVLGPLDPPGSLAATLTTRLPGDGPAGALADQVAAGLPGPHLRAVTALPDLPHPAPYPVPTGPARAVLALAGAADGSWLASADDDAQVRIWDRTTGTVRHVLTGHTGAVPGLLAAPDGSWLACAAAYGAQVWMWDPVTGTVRHVLTGPRGDVRALVVAPDGSWLACAASFSAEVRMWDAATGTVRRTLTGHTGDVSALVVAPDGSWLASAGGSVVRMWDPVTGTVRHVLTGHTGDVRALVVAPDGSWLASADANGELRMWDPGTGAALTSLRVAGGLSHLHVTSATIAAGGERGPYFLEFHRGQTGTPYHSPGVVPVQRRWDLDPRRA
ncbi:MAG TPA: NB-ARC domain-containing protein [Pseudonocardiaceae bacterium]